MRSQFNIDTRHAPQATVLAVSGELDVSNAALLTERMESVLKDGAESAGAPVVIDLRELRFIDSTGLRALLTAGERCAAAGRDFSVVKGQRQVQRLLTLTRVAERLAMREDLEVSSA